MGIKCDAVFEGGGVKGIGFAGAAAALEDAGYEFGNVAGSSAGAIISALIAAGYNGLEIRAEMERVDYKKFKQEDFLDRLGAPGKLLSMGLNFGIYNADYFEEWMAGLLKRKNKVRFGDIRTRSGGGRYAYRMNAIASDLSCKRMLVLPEDLKLFGYNPDDYPIAKAVRMSMSIPLFFEPFRLHDVDGREHIIVDGGLLSNYPVWLFDDDLKFPPVPAFGFRFNAGNEIGSGEYNDVNNIFDYIGSLIRTMLDAHDKQHISQSSGDFERTILIPTTLRGEGNRQSVSATDFDITRNESEELYANGYSAASEFLREWDFGAWQMKYRRRGYKAK